MKLLKELFSFDEYDDDEFSPEGSDDEFDFDFDFENPDIDQDLDFNRGEFEDDGVDNVEAEADYGAEEDYPEGMMDMPHDDYEEDGEGGLVDDLPDEQEELGDIKSEIESLYARLGKLAAAGDLNLLDEPPSEDMDMDMGMEGEPEFASFQDLDMGYEDETMSPSFEPEFDDELTDPARGNPEPGNPQAPPLEDEMNSRFSRRPKF